MRLNLLYNLLFIYIYTSCRLSLPTPKPRSAIRRVFDFGSSAGASVQVWLILPGGLWFVRYNFPWFSVARHCPDFDTARTKRTPFVDFWPHSTLKGNSGLHCVVSAQHTGHMCASPASRQAAAACSSRRSAIYGTSGRDKSRRASTYFPPANLLALFPANDLL